MKLLAFNRILGTLILVLFSFSCSSNLDFNQANDLKLEPVVVANLAYFDVPANKFVTNGVEQTVTIDTPTVDVFNDAFFKNNLARVDFFFEINNTINRAYTLDLVYLDKNDQPLYFTNFVIPAYTGVKNLVTKTDVFANAKLDLLKRTTKIAFILRMSPGPLLTENSTGSIILRSSVTAYLVIQ
ncbi:hypothetical protein [Flavobacterium sp. AED]|uniref:hypothetical protein n=1 Tax=Flavobacterium sp. AED TaxID=1423323 RepID=UPI00057C6FC2|nr:hypothetical protein [Flavobacterium sp. AED]KIA82482.1 hypothetical protein OA85_16605 [Flavobacterium sp. AED]MDI1306547.1 hypothetical protein [bacterium]